MSRTWLIAVWFMFSTPAWTQETAWYDIELVVFENTDPAAGLSETWPDDPGFPELKGAKELIPPGADPVVISELDSAEPATPPEAESPASTEELPSTAQPSPALEVWVPFLLRTEAEFKLSETARRLNRSGRYRVLSHTAWRQALERGGPGTPVHIHSEIGDIETYRRLSRPDLDENAPLGSNVATFEMIQPAGDEAVNGSAVPGEIQATALFPTLDQQPRQIEFPLDGTVTIRLSRYLHIEADMIWHRSEALAETTPAETPPPTEQSPEVEPIEITQNGAPLATEQTMVVRGYRLQESRRMRSKELHYLDHPVYGILALITPVDEAAKRAEQP